MKVALVNPFQIYLVNRRGKIYNRLWPPLCLANAAALLRDEGHQVSIIEANANRMAPGEVASCARGYDKIFVTSSSIDRWQCPNTDLAPFLETLVSLRNVSDQIFVMGPHGSSRPVPMLQLTEVAGIIRGEPEMTIRDICRDMPLSSITGLTYREDGKILSSEDRELFDLNLLPMPAFDLLPMGKYRYELLGDRFALFEGARGCSAKCKFCLKVMYGNKMRRKSPEKLIAEVEWAIKECGVRCAYFFDLEFNASPATVDALCDHLIKKKHNFVWTCQTRLDMVNERVLRKMKAAGCRLIHFGVESGNKQILDSLGKRLSMEKIKEGMKLVHSVGIDTACFFLFGFYREKMEHVRESIDFAKRLNPTYAAFHVATPYPGTEFYDLVEGTLDTKELFPEAYNGEIELQDLKKLCSRAYLEYYLRPSYVVSRIKRGNLRSIGQQVALYLKFVKN